MNYFRMALGLFAVLAFQGAAAQHFLDKKISLSLEGQTLRTVMFKMEEQGGFFFSYEARLLNLDSVVTLKVSQQPTRAVLQRLFQERFQFKETEQHIILQRVAVQERYLTGSVQDASGPVEFASVYTRNPLSLALTDPSGQFRIKVKSLPVQLTVSKMGYKDTTVLASSPFVLFLEPQAVELQEVHIKTSPIERSFVHRWFVSKKLRMHSRNITQFFVNTPYQLSFFPGIGTQGKMAAKSINKVSLNLTGGYSSGSEGVELAGIFNLTQGHAKYAQAAGILNVVEGNFSGAQLSGVHNQVHKNLSGVQASGIGNYLKTGDYGVQVSGLFNVAQALKGTQISGFYNQSDTLEGVQIAGAINRVTGELRGVQIAGLFNSTEELGGVQVGLVNRAKRSSGYSIGLLNLIGNGDASLAFFASESSPWNLALKTGTPKLYSIISVSSTWRGGDPVPGLGVGREFTFSRRAKGLLEYTSYFHQDIFFRIQGLLVFPANTPLRVTAGPVIVYKGNSGEQLDGLKLTEKMAFGGQLGLSWYFQKKNKK